jgi:hypothetical protein
MEVRSIEAIVRALNDAKVQYLIVGGLAVNAYGYERLTRDIDLVIGLEPDNITRGLKALLAIGYQLAIPVTPEEFADPATRETWRREKNMIVLKLWSDVHRRTPIDIFIHEPFDFAAEYAAAKRFEVTGGVSAPIVTWHSLIEMKRFAGRPQDVADIAALEEARRISENGGNDES